MSVDHWNDRYIRVGLEAYRAYWDEAEHPTVDQGLRVALNTVANLVAEEMY